MRGIREGASLLFAVSLNVFGTCSADKESATSPLRVSGIVSWGFDSEQHEAHSARRRRRSGVTAKLHFPKRGRTSQLSRGSWTSRSSSPYRISKSFHRKKNAQPLSSGSLTSRKNRPPHVSRTSSQALASTHVSPHSRKNGKIGSHLSDAAQMISQLSKHARVLHRSDVSHKLESQVSEFSTVTKDDLMKDVEAVDNFVNEAESGRTSSDKHAVTIMEETIQMVEVTMIEETTVIVEEEVVLIEELTEEVIQVIDFVVEEEILDVEEVKDDEEKEVDKTKSATDKVMVQILKDDVQELKSTIKVDKEECKTNAKSITDLKKQLGQAEKTLLRVVGLVVEQSTSNILKETLLKVEKKTQIVAEEHSIEACQETVGEIAKLVRDGLKKEVQGNEEYSGKLRSDMNTLRDHVRTVSTAAGAQIQSMAEKLKLIIEDMRSIFERAKKERKIDIMRTDMLLRKADGLTSTLADGAADDAALKKCVAGIELQRELADSLGNMVSEQLTRQGKEMSELRQRLAGDDEQIMIQSQECQKQSSSEITKVGELLKKTQVQERRVTSKKTKETLKKMETKIEKTIIVTVEKRVERTCKSSEKMLTKLKESVQSTSEKLQEEQQAREKTDAKVEDMKGQMRVLMDKIQSSTSEADVASIKRRLEVTADKLNKETAERKKAESEIEALKQMVSSLAAKVDSQAIEMRTSVKESKKQLKEVKSLHADAQKAVTRVENIGIKCEKSSTELKKSIEKISKVAEQEIEQREKSNDELLELKNIVIVTSNKAEARIVHIRTEQKKKEKAATEQKKLESMTRTEEKAEKTVTASVNSEKEKEIDTEIEEKEKALKAEAEEEEEKAVKAEAEEEAKIEKIEKASASTQSKSLETSVDKSYKRLQEIRAKEAREIEQDRKKERELKKTRISDVCTSNVIVPDVYSPRGAEGACIDSQGNMYDSWYGPIDCVKECKKACSQSSNCVGFDIFDKTMCETRYDGEVPITKPWPKAQGQWSGGGGKGPVKGVQRKGIEDRTCFVKM